ncbi:ADAM metallopeptidase with thrombospondin type 1 motif B [Carabus blaptoides fortunei]
MFTIDSKVNYSVLYSCAVVLLVSVIMTGDVRGQLMSKEHRTQAASERNKDMWCYHCNTMDSGDKCVDLSENKTDQHVKCRDEGKACMVKRISLTTSTGNSTSSPRLWLLERNCSKHCEPGCIMIGERTKLHACITCCEGDFCSMCFTTEFYNLTGDVEQLDDGTLIDSEDDESEGNGSNADIASYSKRLPSDLRSQIDPEEMGYFFDSTWEMHVFKKKSITKVSAPPRWLDIAIGVDHSVINFHGKSKVNRYILALMNIVSAIYQDPSLDANLNLVLTRMILYEHKRYGQVKEGNARKSLENVNAWNRKLHSTLLPGEARHDVAVWLTRMDIGGPSGYAPVSGACDASRSCTLNRDEGLTSAFIIAHEMAHVLGLTHDGDMKANNSCTQEAMEGSVMAPMVAATFHKFSWSTCSKMEFHKRAANWHCLKNPPKGKEEVLLKGTLWTTFSMDEQCRMEFGEGFELCKAFDIIEPCSHLWCGHKDSPMVCKTKKGPPLEGTECGLNKYCVNGYCESLNTYGYQLDPVTHNPQDGGWSEWSAWTPCSRTCAFGVQFRSRQCNNPSPAYGGKLCKGSREEFSICSKDPCPEPLRDIRAEQCARLPKLIKLDDPVKMNMTWLPYESEKKLTKCQLICLSKQSGDVFVSKENLLDGTPCSYDIDSDICVQGNCQTLGCDGMLGGVLKEDSCGICGGNNSMCSNISNEFQRNVRRENNRIVVLPRLARNILVQCGISTVRNNLHNTVFLTMRDRRKGIKYNLSLPNGKTSTGFIVQGAKFHYSKKANVLKLWARGSILEEIVISLYVPPSIVNSGITMTVRTSYSMRKHSAKGYEHRYIWSLGGWGPCTASCGGGKRQRTVACRDTIENRIVTRRHCPLSQKPGTITQECNTYSCRFHWVPSEWEHCTATCGSSGTQNRELYCVHNSITTASVTAPNGTFVESKLWKDAVLPDRCPAERPEVVRACNRLPCIGYWKPTLWSDCSESCGAGFAMRDFHCPPPHGEPVYTCGPKPVAEKRKCNGEFTRHTNPLCKGRKRKSCVKDESKYCALKEYLGKYCVIAEFRKICCKSCTGRKHTLVM